MKTLKLLNYAQDRWHAGDGALAPVHSAVTGETIAETGSGGLEFAAMLDHGPQGGIVRAELRHRRHAGR